MTKDRPNLVLITTDAQRWDAYGFLNPEVSTPHIDLMAGKGTRFRSCSSPHVLCQPARASILTGLYPLSNGVYDNGIDLDPSIGERGFAGRLAETGYSTAFIGKAHFATRRTFEATDTPGNQHPESVGPDNWSGPYMGFQSVELAVNGHNLVAPSRPPVGMHYERWYYEDGLGDLKNNLHVKRLPPEAEVPLTWNSALPPAWHNATWVADRTIAQLEAQSDDPFCFWISFADPHPPFDAPAPWCYLHRPNEVTPPPYRDIRTDDRPWWHRAALEQPGRIYDDARMVDDKRHEGFQRTAPSDPDAIRTMLANYYGSVSLVDHNIGRIVKALHETGHGRDTVIALTSDHGFFIGEHGLLLQNPMLYEPLTRVSMIFHGPGVTEDYDVAAPVSTIDIGATFLDLAGVDASPLRHSRSLLPVMSGDDGDRTHSLMEWDIDSTRYCLGRPVKLRMVRTGTHKLIVDELSGEGELYDLVDDPHELSNLFNDPASADLRSELMDLIRSRPSDHLPRMPERVGYY